MCKTIRCCSSGIGLPKQNEPECSITAPWPWRLRRYVPSARIVLLKGLDEDGFRWFTDGRSEKGLALADNPQAELLFHWRELDRQVRVRGVVTRLSEKESDAYFYSRPLDSQLAAATSEQSQPVESRDVLEQRYRALTDSIRSKRRARRLGAVTCSNLCSTNFGRVGKGVCTTGCSIA